MIVKLTSRQHFKTDTAFQGFGQDKYIMGVQF